MTRAGFDVEAWIERLAQLLPPLAQTQGPFLREYQERYARVIDMTDGKPPRFPLEDLRLVYDEVRDSRPWGLEAHYSSLRAVLNPVRHALLGHPTLERVAVTGRLIGDNRFSMEILGSGGDIYAGTLIAGLMARAAELPEDGFRTALRELNAFLLPSGNGAAGDALGSLDVACDMFLFYGLCLSERIEVEDGMVLLPYKEVLRCVDQEIVEKFAPSGAGFHGWRAVGAVARPFRWRPEFRRRGRLNGPLGPPPPPFFPDAAALLDLLAVSHATRIAPLATLSNRIDGSARRLLGREEQSPGLYQSWSAEGFSGFDECPAISREALAVALEAFRNRESPRYKRMAPIVTRLSEALARSGRFALHDKVVDVSIALEGMYELPRWGVTRALEERVSGFLAGESENRERIRESARAFYEARSAIVHSRSAKGTPFTNGAAFVSGFGLARRSLFKLLREGSPGEWNAAADAGNPSATRAEPGAAARSQGETGGREDAR